MRTGRKHSLAASFDPFEQLEPRVLLSTFAFQDLESLLVQRAPIHVLEPAGEHGPSKTIRSSVASIGDIDGDGAPDFIVGAGGRAQGGHDGDDWDDDDDHDDDHRYDDDDDDDDDLGRAFAAVYSGATGDLLYTVQGRFSEFGSAVAGLGDLNGDGINDFAVGSPRDGSSNPGRSDGPGAAYVYSGANGDLLFRVSGFGGGDRFGTSVAGLGDVNGDGTPDIAVGAPGADAGGEDRGVVYMLSGTDGAVIRRVAGDAERGRFGFSIAGMGDMNDDGAADVLVGAPGVETGNIRAPGRAFLISGVDGVTLLRLSGSQERDLFGYALTGVGDMNDDGTADFAVGAPGHDVRGSSTIPNAGRVIVYSGADGAPLMRIVGEFANDNLGAAVASAGDVNDDGSGDLLVGVPNADERARVIVVSGDSGEALTVYSAGRHRLIGSDRIGTSIAAAGDVDGDGVTDFLFGATQDANPDKNDRNRFYVFSGLQALDLIPEGVNDDMDIWGTTAQGSFLYLNGELFLLAGREGFMAGDRVVDVSENGAVLGVDENGDAFLWRTDTRVALSDRIVNDDGSMQTFTSMRAIDLTDGGFVLIERTRDDGVVSAWVLEGDTLSFRFDGAPLAMNNAGTIVGLDNDAMTNTSILWTASDGAVMIGDFVAADLNEDGDIVGRAFNMDGTSFMAIREPDGTLIDIGTIGDDPEVSSINNDRLVIGAYTTASGGTGAFVFDPAMGISDVRRVVTMGEPEAFNRSDDITLVAMNNNGKIVGIADDADLAFVLTQIDEAGPFLTERDGGVALSLGEDGTLIVTTTNMAGEVLVFRLERERGDWVATDLHTEDGVPLARTDVITMRDPRSGENLIAVATTDGLLLLRRDENGEWVARNLSNELDGAELIVANLVHLVTRDGRILLIGQAEDGDLVAYEQAGATDGTGRAAWVFTNLYEDELTPRGQALPDFTGDLVAYVTPWNGLNIAGLNRQGELEVVWTAPALDGWAATNLSAVTGAPTIAGGVTAFVTPWGGINLIGLNGDGELVTTWWVPGFAGTWLTNNLTQEFDGARLRGGSVTSYVTSWGGLNIAGLDDDGEVQVYWWVPGFERWVVTPILIDIDDDDVIRPIGRLRGHAAEDGSIHLLGAGRRGEIVRMHWSPGESWRAESLSSVGEM